MPEVTTPAASERRYSAFGPSPFSLNGICFRFRMMSVASSTTPVIDWNSCNTPSILTAVTAAPSIDESSVRRSALPIVVPNPRSKGWALNLPKLGVRVSCSTARRLGFWKPLQSMVVLSSSPREAFCGADGTTVVVMLAALVPQHKAPHPSAESRKGGPPKLVTLLAVKFDD